MLSAKNFENLHAVMAILVLFEQGIKPLEISLRLNLGSAKFIFSGLSPDQVFPRLILQVQFRFKLKIF